MATEVTLIPPSGSAIIFSSETPYRLVSLDGIGPMDAQPRSARVASQMGTTLRDITIGSRVVELASYIRADSVDTLWRLRADLATVIAAMPYEAVSPASAGLTDGLRVGRLRIANGLKSVEMPAVVQSSHLPMPKNLVGILPIELEIFGPDPRWRSTSDSTISLPAVNTNVDAVQAGDIPGPLFVRIDGPLTTPRLLNLTTGASIEITGAVATGDYIEIDTTRGAQTVEQVVSGVRSNAMSRLNLAVADFPQLWPGANTMRLQRASGTGGSATITWRNRYSGI